MTEIEGRTQRKKEDTRQKIIATAVSLFRERGFDAVTMEQISVDVDIAKGTLYNYFPVKEAILDEYIRRSFKVNESERLARLRELPDTRARMRNILTDLITGIRAQKDLFERYFVYRIQKMIALKADESAASGMNVLETEIIRLGQASGELRSDMPPSLLMALFEFTFVEIAQMFYNDPAAFDAQTGIEQCVELFMNGARGA